MTVNGKSVELQSEVSLEEYLRANNYNPERVAVELNGAIVRKGSFHSTVLDNDSIVEIVQFMGGG